MRGLLRRGILHVADAGAPPRGLLRVLHVELVVQAIHQLQLQAGMGTVDEGMDH